MILRLLHLRVLPGATSELVERLRSRIVPEAMAQPGQLALNYGIRQQGPATHAVALSIWQDFEAISSSLGDQLGGVGTSVPLDDLVTDVETAHYEVAEPEDSDRLAADGALMGIVVARLKPHVEPTAFDMIRQGRDALYVAGAVARYVGRRVAGARSEVIAVAIWPDRATLRQFAHQRPEGLISRDFLDLLESWKFETYDTMSPQRLLVPSSSGPAVLLADSDGRYVDASPGVERVFGVPGEFMLGLHVWDFTPGVALDAGRQLWREFIEQGSSAGQYSLLRPDGTQVAIQYRARAHCPRPGVHASLLWLPDDEPDSRSLEEVVDEAFGARAPRG